MFGLKLIFILIIISGLIAYLGDRLGRQIGKKRLTLFGLRPKHTAMVITITTGILITIFTLAVLSIISEDARDALFHMERIKNQINILTKKYKKQEKDLRFKEEELKIKTKSYQKLTKKIEKTNRQFAYLKKELDEVNKKRHQIEIELEKVSQEYDQMKTKLRKEKKKTEELRQTKEKLTEMLHHLQGRKKELEGKIESLRAQGDEVFARLQQVQKELQQAEKEKEKIQLNLAQTKIGKIIFGADEELARLKVSAGQSKEKIKEELIASLRQANEVALKRGAKTDNLREGIMIYQEDFMETVEILNRMKGEYLVRILSRQNTVEGEPVYIQFEIVENKLIFKSQEVIVEDVVKVGETQVEIERKLLDMLRQARKVALDAGALPSAEGEIGGISALEFYNLVNLMKGTLVDLQVQIIALEDIYISGPLNIRFRVREIK